MSTELSTAGELRENIALLIERFAESATDFPMIFVPGVAGPLTTAAALRGIAERATVGQLGLIRKQLAEAEGRLIQDERRNAQSSADDARRAAARYSELTDQEVAARDAVLRDAAAAAARQSSTEQRLERIERHLETIADALAKR
jgi:hypothetical protein